MKHLLLLAAIFVCGATFTTHAQTPADPLAEARALFAAGRYDDVLAKLNSAAPGDNADFNTLLGLAHYRKNNHARAVEFLTAAVRQQRAAKLETTREHRESVTALGLAHYLLGHLNEAVPLLEQAAAWTPGNNEFTYALGMAAIQTRQPDKARAAFARMFQVAPDSAAARLLNAQMMIRVEFEEFAEPELKAALAQDPRLAQANYLLGQIAIYKGRLDEGVELMQREIAVNPGNANAYYKLGDAYTRLLKWDEAVAALQKSVWLNPYFSGPYILLGKSYLKKRELASAEGMLKRAIQFDPNNKSAHYMLAQVYQQMGRAEDARREFAIAEKLQGNAEDK